MCKVKDAIEEEMRVKGQSTSWRDKEPDEDDVFQDFGKSRRIITHSSGSDPLHTVKELAANYQPKPITE